MFSDVEIKLKRRNKILFTRDSQCLQELIELIQLQSHRTLVMWALDCEECLWHNLKQSMQMNTDQEPAWNFVKLGQGVKSKCRQQNGQF